MSAPKEEQVTILEELLTERRSCRAYLGTPVPPQILGRLLTMAQRSPSWCNTQPWHVTVIEGDALEAIRYDFADYVQTHSGETDFPFPERYTGEFLERRRECAWQLYDSVGIVRGDRHASGEQTLENFRFFGAPAVAVITTEADLGTYGAVDCGVYVAHFLLAAQSLGLAAIAQAALASHAPFLRERLGIPEHRKIVVGISFGYADDDHPVNGFLTSRADIDAVATVIS
ncbi:nitroreductase [Rhodococcus sp. ACS1]|uniref:nitroreductase n=1 Tax=Rhodococcus sp. ACS1 TaxID=2028570 RepID=UPI000BB12547|nr:nitroreductase [Rhodococcus sp. ACS1]PBC39485.1 nitroreductase [Rhodococcus sp. ACS1]